jgi:adenosine deaminase
VEEVLQNFYPVRIGHGVRSLESDALMHHLKTEHIHLEVCPSSNVRTGIYDSLKQHRIHEIYENGNSLSINTDGRTISNVSLRDEYQSLNQLFNWDTEHFLRCNQYAIEAAFCGDELKESLHRKLLKGFRKAGDS